MRGTSGPRPGQRQTLSGRRVAVGAGATVVLLSAVLVLAAAAGVGQQGAESMRSLPADDRTAADVLGRPVPQPRELPPGMVRSAIAADPASKTIGPRYVHQSFAIAGRNVARLSVWRGDLGRVEGDVVTLGGRSVITSVSRLPDGTSDVAYFWSADGLSFTLHINLIGAVTRDLADRLTASVR